MVGDDSAADVTFKNALIFLPSTKKYKFYKINDILNDFTNVLRDFT